MQNKFLATIIAIPVSITAVFDLASLVDLDWYLAIFLGFGCAVSLFALWLKLSKPESESELSTVEVDPYVLRDPFRYGKASAFPGKVTMNVIDFDNSHFSITAGAQPDTVNFQQLWH